MKVLLIDDDEDQLALRSLILQHHGYCPECASDPEAALNIARNDPPGIAVVDLGLPTENDGWNLISRLKQTVPEVSIVVLSGASQTALQQSPQRESVNAWITKGGGARSLIETLQNIASL